MTTIYMWYESPLWLVGWRRRHRERLFQSAHSQQALEFAREQLRGQGGGLIRHYDVNGFLQGEERVVVATPEERSRRRLSALAR